MSDAALWAEAATPELGWERGAFLEVHSANQAEAQRHVVDADLVAMAVHRLIEGKQEWEAHVNGMFGCRRDDELKEIWQACTDFEHWVTVPSGHEPEPACVEP